MQHGSARAHVRVPHQQGHVDVCDPGAAQIELPHLAALPHEGPNPVHPPTASEAEALQLAGGAEHVAQHVVMQKIAAGDDKAG